MLSRLVQPAAVVTHLTLLLLHCRPTCTAKPCCVVRARHCVSQLHAGPHSSKLTTPADLPCACNVEGQ